MNQKHQKLKEKVIKNIEKKQKRNHAFRHLTNHIGKGIKGNLKRSHIMNENNINNKNYWKENTEK